MMKADVQLMWDSERTRSSLVLEPFGKKFHSEVNSEGLKEDMTGKDNAVDPHRAVKTTS